MNCHIHNLLNMQKKLRILIDTNILIHSEDAKEIDIEVQKFHKLSKYFDFFVHPYISQDLNKDKDKKRKDIIKSKLWKYNVSDFSRQPDESYYSIISKPKKDNDRIDDNLLFAVKNIACDYLVTEDRWIMSKSFKLGIENKVFSIKKFNEYIESLYDPDKKLDSINNVTHDRIYNVDSTASDQIFDSLKEDYYWFEEWYKKIVAEGRKWFFILWGDKRWILWLCLYDDHNDDYLDWIKICTFKVSEIKKWNKSWELLLRQMFLYAMSEKRRYLYVEVKKEKEFFIEWLKSFGFYILWDKHWDSDSFVLKKDIFYPSQDKWIIFNYPFFYFDDQVNIFLIPIQSKFSSKLFPDLHSQLSINLDDNICWNTIKKSYLSKKNNKQIKKWDLVFFYETWTWKWIKEKNYSIISFWIVDDILYTDDEITATLFISKRSVYSLSEIRDITKWGAFIINFRYFDSLKNPINYDTLLLNKILNWAPQSITKLNRESFPFIKKHLWSYYQ